MTDSSVQPVAATACVENGELHHKGLLMQDYPVNRIQVDKPCNPDDDPIRISADPPAQATPSAFAASDKEVLLDNV